VFRRPPRPLFAYIYAFSMIAAHIDIDLRDDELYVAVPRKDLSGIAEEAQTIAAANARLSEYHNPRFAWA
jgi:hypothetical protein